METSRIDTSNWMSQLPERLHTAPLNNIAIPGSHDSLSYSIDAHHDISPDNSQQLQAIIAMFGNCGKEIVYRWSVTQNFTVTQQLTHGIRYFDLRIARHKKNQTLNFVHGLYGAEVMPVLEEINSFLEAHPKEIVLLDFNHFYEMEAADHLSLMAMITDVFGSKICPLLNIEGTTLEALWDNALQVIIFYQNDAAKDDHMFWPASAIRSPYANTANLPQLMAFLDSHFKEGHEEDIFYVWQGILTPGVDTVMTHFCSSLKDCLCNKVDPIFVSWLREKHIGKNGITVCIMDFVENADYITAVIALNR